MNRLPLVVWILAVWLGLAVLAGASGLQAQLRPPLPQALLAALTLLTILACRLVPAVRRWAAGVDPRVLVTLHLARFAAGLDFLLLGFHGELPETFTVPAGAGDIAVAVVAALLLLTVRPAGRAGKWTYWLWNALGSLDILGVVASAAVHGMGDPASMAPLGSLPLSLLPAFLVPLIIASHMLLFVRLRGCPSQGNGSPAQE